MITVDAHQHFWDPERGDYGWLTPDLAHLYRSLGPDALAPELDVCAVRGTGVVQAAATEHGAKPDIAGEERAPWAVAIMGGNAVSFYGLRL